MEREKDLPRDLLYPPNMDALLMLNGSPGQQELISATMVPSRGSKAIRSASLK
jgi:hypothetical protein